MTHAVALESYRAIGSTGSVTYRNKRSSKIETKPQYKFVPWAQFLKQFVWQQGEHVLSIGGTGSGKTTLSARLLDRRKRVVVCVSKGSDPTFAKEFKGYEIIQKWPPPKEWNHKVLLWPRGGDDIRKVQTLKQDVFRHMFNRILLKEGGWCISIDELHYMVSTLKLGPEITDILEQGRSFHISLWGNSQRPSGIPLASYTNATHGFFYLTQESYDVDRLASMANVHTSPDELSANIRSLGKHEFVYVNKYSDSAPIRSKVLL